MQRRARRARRSRRRGGSPRGRGRRRAGRRGWTPSARSASTPSGPVISTYGGTPVAGAGTVTGASLPRPRRHLSRRTSARRRRPRAAAGTAATAPASAGSSRWAASSSRLQPEVDPLLELGVLVPGPRMTLGDRRAGRGRAGRRTGDRARVDAAVRQPPPSAPRRCRAAPARAPAAARPPSRPAAARAARTIALSVVGQNGGSERCRKPA